MSVLGFDGKQMSDLAFRRHILVQALILVDFILSLTPKAKRKLANTTNKSVLYSYVVSDDDVRGTLEDFYKFYVSITWV